MTRAQTATANSNLIPNIMLLSVNLPAVPPGCEEERLQMNFLEGLQRIEALGKRTDTDLKVERGLSGILDVTLHVEQYLWEITAFRERILRLLSHRIGLPQSYQLLGSAEAREAEIAKASLTAEARQAFLLLMSITDDDAKLFSDTITSGYLKIRMHFAGQTVNLYEFLMANPALQTDQSLARALAAVLWRIVTNYRDRAMFAWEYGRKLVPELAPDLNYKPVGGGD